VLELADFTLNKFLEDFYPNGMPEKIAFFFFEQIVRGVQYMHTKGIIHRDLKAPNILIKDYKIKICDFNVCRFINEDLENPQPLTRVGTRNYLPPEFAKGESVDKELWPKVDVYSMGVLLYVMLYGKEPYKYSVDFVNPGRMANVIRNINFDKEPKVSEEAISFIKACLNPEIKQRIGTNEMKNQKWFQAVGSEFSKITKTKKFGSHKDLYTEILR